MAVMFSIVLEADEKGEGQMVVGGQMMKQS